ncbi:MAG: hypothetical protein WC222_08790 [Parachlamydiales bacterium]
MVSPLNFDIIGSKYEAAAWAETTDTFSLDYKDIGQRLESLSLTFRVARFLSQFALFSFLENYYVEQVKSTIQAFKVEYLNTAKSILAKHGLESKYASLFENPDFTAERFAEIRRHLLYLFDVNQQLEEVSSSWSPEEKIAVKQQFYAVSQHVLPEQIKATLRSIYDQVIVPQILERDTIILGLPSDFENENEQVLITLDKDQFDFPKWEEALNSPKVADSKKISSELIKHLKGVPKLVVEALFNEYVEKDEIKILHLDIVERADHFEIVSRRPNLKFEQLPLDMLERIVQFLPDRALLNAQATDRTLRTLAETEIVKRLNARKLDLSSLCLTHTQLVAFLGRNHDKLKCFKLNDIHNLQSNQQLVELLSVFKQIDYIELENCRIQFGLLKSLPVSFPDLKGLSLQTCLIEDRLIDDALKEVRNHPLVTFVKLDRAGRVVIDRFHRDLAQEWSKFLCLEELDLTQSRYISKGYFSIFWMSFVSYLNAPSLRTLKLGSGFNAGVVQEHISKFKNLEHLVLDMINLDRCASIVDKIKDLPNMHTLEIKYETGSGEAAIRKLTNVLGGLKGLKSLSIHYRKTATSLEEDPRGDIEILSSQIEADFMAAIGKLKNLRRICIQLDPIHSLKGGMDSFLELEHLEVIELTNHSLVGGMHELNLIPETIVKELLKIREIKFTGNFAHSTYERLVNVLPYLPQLEVLEVCKPFPTAAPDTPTFNNRIADHFYEIPLLKHLQMAFVFFAGDTKSFIKNLHLLKNLASMDISYSNLRVEQLLELINSLQILPKLQKLIIKGLITNIFPYDINNWKDVSKAISKLTHLTELDLSDNQMPTLFLMEIIQNVHKMKNLTHINLDGNHRWLLLLPDGTTQIKKIFSANRNLLSIRFNGGEFLREIGGKITPIRKTISKTNIPLS